MLVQGEARMKHRSARTALFLLLLALAQAAGAVLGETVDVPGGSYQLISPDDLGAMLASKDFLLVNVHVPYEGEIEPTDLFIPYDTVAQNLGQLPDREARLVFYCKSGSMSETAVVKLVSFGYKNLYELDGGMAAWEAAGNPVVTKPQ
jgi:rhodanese-related sulfurtransferase